MATRRVEISRTIGPHDETGTQFTGFLSIEGCTVGVEVGLSQPYPYLPEGLPNDGVRALRSLIRVIVTRGERTVDVTDMEYIVLLQILMEFGVRLFVLRHGVSLGRTAWVAPNGKHDVYLDSDMVRELMRKFST